MTENANTRPADCNAGRIEAGVVDVRSIANVLEACANTILDPVVALIQRGLAASDQRAAAWGSIFLELFPQRMEGLTLEPSDRTTEAVQNIALEEGPDVGSQVLWLC